MEKPKSRFSARVDRDNFVKLRVKLLEMKPSKPIVKWLEEQISKEIAK